jgi:hypothetical protein
MEIRDKESVCARVTGVSTRRGQAEINATPSEADRTEETDGRSVCSIGEEQNVKCNEDWKATQCFLCEYVRKNNTHK